MQAENSLHNLSAKHTVIFATNESDEYCYASVLMRKQGMFVCVCGLLQLLKDESSASKSFYKLLVMFSWITILGFAK